MVDDVVKCSSHIPKTNVSTSNNTVPGWSEHVKPYKDEAIFWKRQWDQLGQPPQGLVAHYMRRSRADYHYAIRYVWQNEKSLKQQNFLTSMLKGGRDFHSEIKKIKACTQTIPKCVNGKSEPPEIAELFAEKRKYIYLTPIHQIRMILRRSCLTFIVGLQVILVVSTMLLLPKMKLIKLLR